MDIFKNDVRDYAVATYETVREELKSCWQFTRDAWVLILLLLTAVGVVIWLAKPAPPDHVVMGTGSDGGSYEELAKKYVEYFKKYGVTLELVKTAGAEENVQRIIDRQDQLQAAFIQGGLLSDHAQAKGLKSLGSIGYEPVWIFYRNDLFSREQVFNMHFLKEPMAIGQPGSGTYQHALQLLQLNHIDLADHFKTISNEEAIKAFENGTVNAVLMVDGIDAQNVRSMINNPLASIAGIQRAEAFARILPAYHVLSIPEGSLDFSRNEPSKNIQTISPTTNLVIDPHMHPAIQLLFLKAAKAINGGRSFFSYYGEFPNFKKVTSQKDSIRVAPPRMLEYIPFWLAEFLNRMLILLLPLGAFAYPIIKSMPGYRTNRARSRINEVYGALKLFEQEIENNFDLTQKENYLKTIDALDKKAQSLRVPRGLMSEYYSLRTTIDFVRNVIERPLHHVENVSP